PEVSMFGAAIDPSSWSFRRLIKADSGGVQQLELTPHVLAYAQAGLSDLRLVADGKQVPFLLERSEFHRSVPLDVSRADDPKSPRLSRWALHLPQARLPITRVTCETKAPL